MILESGTRLGPYEISVLAGSGGMGEVYRGRDTRLNRDVAIKVLPPGVATSGVRRARFEREARAISRLNHPHICTIYDLGEQGGVAFLVMEYIDGPSLEQRLRAGRLPVPQALDAAIQIASALCAAHEQGIVHRDLKPGNVMLADSGIKLLDFGIAKLLDEDDGPSRDGATVAATLTAEHKVVGTLNYMAPEQLEGREIDQRADLFAFGALLYEMLTGQKAFPGSSAATVTAAVLTAEPPPFASAVPDATVPRALDHIIRRALAKQPDDRWQTARDVMLELRAIRDNPSHDMTASVAAIARPSSRRRSWLPIAAALAAFAAGAELAWTLAARKSALLERPLTVLTVPAPDGTRLSTGYGTLAVSPDGLKIAFVADTAGSESVWIRYLNSAVPQRVPGSEGATAPFWSPDGRFLAFYRNRTISRVDLDGGSSEDIVTAMPDGTPAFIPAATWMPDDSIVFGRDRVLLRVPAHGGEPVPIAAPVQNSNERSFWFPTALSDGRLLFIVRGPQFNNGARIQDASGRDVINLPGVLSNAALAAGHLIFRQGPALVAQPFDERARGFSGQPFVLAYDVLYNPSSGRTVFSASDELIAYRSDASRRLTWIDRSGRRSGSVGEEGRAWNPAIAPDGSNRVAFDRFDPASDGFQVWIVDDQGRTAPFTHNVKARFAIWSPDGQWIAHTAIGERTSQIRRHRTAAPDRDELILEKDHAIAPVDWTSDGRFIIYSSVGDLWMVPLAEPRTPVQLTKTPGIESVGRVSPDSKWLAYSTREGGRSSVWLQSFPTGSAPQRIGSGDSFDPSWRKDGKELYYMTADGTLMAVPVTSQAPLTFGAPAPLFRVSLNVADTNRHAYAAAPDGQRFLVTEPVQADPPITVLVHWPALVRR